MSSNYYRTDDELRATRMYQEVDPDFDRDEPAPSRRTPPAERPGRAGSGSGGSDRSGGPGRSSSPPPRRRNRARTALLITLALLLILAGGGVLTLYLVSEKLGGQVQRFEAFAGLDESRRPKDVTSGAGAGALNILLAGTDARIDPGSQTVEDLERGGQRSDTIMIMHITGDRKHAYLISIPRDTWVEIPGKGMHKINAAYALGGPSLFVETVERFTNMRMHHLAVINWQGFMDLTDALGGVEINFPERTLLRNGKYYGPGVETLSGEEALDYVRERKTLKEGDFDRARRQQNYLRSLMNQTLAKGTSLSKIGPVIDAITKNLYVDEGFTNGKMRDLAFEMRNIRGDDVSFILLPRAKQATGYEGDQSVVYHDPVKTKALFDALKKGQGERWLKKYGSADNVLGQTVR